MEDFALTPAEQALFRALVARRVRFMIIGLGAALVEGAAVATQHIDLWFEHIVLTSGTNPIGGAQVSSGGASSASSGSTGSVGVGVGSGAGAGGTVTPQSACIGQTGILTAAPVRRLTRAEYNATVATLLLDTTSPAVNLPPELLGDLFSNDSEQQPVSADLVSGYNTIAADIATRATQAATLAQVAPCAGAA